MIRTDRSRVSIPSALSGDKAVGAREVVKACAFFGGLSQALGSSAPAPSQKKTFKFAAYSEPSVKEALSSLFGGKCAYCESRYATTQPMDVEHYRPKARVDGCAGHFGYYWLAADWNNLLPSCIDCNRVREQTVPVWGGGGEEPLLRPVCQGKGDRFPLRDESKRAQSPGEESTEEPLLLHPCWDEPSDYLEFDDDGFVQPRRMGSAAERQKAQASIEIYALNRAGLVQTRLEVLRLLQARLYAIKQLVRILDQDPPPNVLDLVEDLLSHEFHELRRFRSPEQPYSLMCRQMVDRFLEELTPGDVDILTFDNRSGST